MSTRLRLPSWLQPPTADAAIEITARRVNVVQLTAGSPPSAAGYATVPLPEGAVTPVLTARNVHQPKAVADTIRRAFEQANLRMPKRVSLVVPDAAVRVGLVPLESIPAKAADLEQLVRWQIRKTVPFPADEGVVSFAPAGHHDGKTTFAAVMARRDVIAEYEDVVESLGLHPGDVGVSSLQVVNAAVVTGAGAAGDWLLVCLTADGTTMAIMRGADLLFHRHRPAADDEPLTSLVHQTAMFFEDRLGGGAFGRVLVTGQPAGEDIARVLAAISDRLRVPAAMLDVRPAAAGSAWSAASPDLLDALAAPIGAILAARRPAKGAA